MHAIHFTRGHGEQVKSHMWVFINALIENPAFDSQTKETLTLKPSAFGSKAEFDDKFFKKMMSGTTILDSFLSFGQDKQAHILKSPLYADFIQEIS